MKRLIKVIIVLSGVAALLVGAYFLEGHLNSSKGSRRGKITPFKAISMKVENSWGQKIGWDEELYTSLISDVEGSLQMGNINKKQYGLLIESVNLQALSVIEHAFDSLMSSPSCRHEQVVWNNEGVERISKFEDGRGYHMQLFKDDTRVKTLQSMFNDYNVTRNFAMRSFAVEAVMDGTTWKPFGSYYKSGWDRKRSEYENGRYFQSHFSKINVIKNGWDSYPTKVAESEKSYYRTIAKSVQSYMNTHSRILKSDYNRLDIKYGQYMSRYRSLQEQIKSKEAEIETGPYSSQALARLRLDELKQDMTDIETDMAAFKKEISSLVSDYKNYQRICVDIQSRLTSEAGNLNLREITDANEALASAITGRNEIRHLENLSDDIPL